MDHSEEGSMSEGWSGVVRSGKRSQLCMDKIPSPVPEKVFFRTLMVGTTHPLRGTGRFGSSAVTRGHPGSL
jgi:hypothetical protein